MAVTVGAGVPSVERVPLAARIAPCATGLCEKIVALPLQAGNLLLLPVY